MVRIFRYRKRIAFLLRPEVPANREQTIPVHSPRSPIEVFTERLRDLSSHIRIPISRSQQVTTDTSTTINMPNNEIEENVYKAISLVEKSVDKKVVVRKLYIAKRLNIRRN